MSAVDVAFSPIQANRHINNGPLDHCSNESIVIYITIAGSVTPMRVLESDSIASVKLRIQTNKGFVMKRQKLVFGGRQLSRNDSLVKDYGVTDGNVLHLVLKLSDLLVINVRTTSGKEFEFHVGRHQNVGYLKLSILKRGKDFVGEELEVQEFFCDGEKLEDQRLIHDITSTTDAVIHLVVQKKTAKVRAKHLERDVELSVVAANWNEGRGGGGGGVVHCDGNRNSASSPDKSNSFVEPIILNPNNIELPSSIRDMITCAFNGLANGKTPIRSSEGSGGTYFMQDVSGDKYVAVFKPIDEEPLAVNNPQGLPLSSNGEGLKRGTKVGEGALREVAAFLLDHPKAPGRSRSLYKGEIGFSGVAPTVMVQCLHEGFHHPDGFEWLAKYIKVGSLQLFMKNEGNCEDIGPRDFPVEEVHKITVFDIRTANADRHAGNILISRHGEEGRIVLTPIDHGYCLPEHFEDCTLDWLYWPQARVPYSLETIDYIKSLDAEEDIALLKLCGWDLSVECARTLRISTMLLKKGVERVLTPFTIGSIMCRETLNKESVIEEIVNEAQDSILPGTSEAAFLERVSKLIDIRLEKIEN
ncbi:phosphatidylinositol 4-kinase gamma 4 [Nicotiana tabacum]|uniref:1-phosphatidylinositol 4-kinase n=1 Tax=Nicotiana tabacum TaxID=4097 RepID=A0A1S4BDJ0_TOBAC|nr:PREDICTED: phosphatidylinositol 4-kinase gamma 4-like [Nicotiana tabacum]